MLLLLLLLLMLLMLQVDFSRKRVLAACLRGNRNVVDGPDGAVDAPLTVGFTVEVGLPSSTKEFAFSDLSKPGEMRTSLISIF